MIRSSNFTVAFLGARTILAFILTGFFPLLDGLSLALRACGGGLGSGIVVLCIVE